MSVSPERPAPAFMSRRGCVACRELLGRLHGVLPLYWELVLLLALALFSMLVPSAFWRHLLDTAGAHKLLFSLLLVLFVLAVSLVWSAGQRIDAAVFAFFNAFGGRPEWLDVAMQLLTELGNGFATAGIAVLFYFLAAPMAAYAYILGTLALWLAVMFMKSVFRRPRPYSSLESARVVGARAGGNSFPSGHTGQAFFSATMLLLYFDGLYLAHILLYLLAALVGVTRMYLGMHYPRDVLAGAILGTIWGSVWLSVNSAILPLIGCS